MDMTRNENIETFIRACFNEFCLDYEEYFTCTDEKGTSNIVPLLRKGKLNKDAVKFVSRILGFSVEDIMTCNYEAMLDRKNRYPYFKHYKGLEKAYEMVMAGPRYAEYKLREAIAGTRLPLPVRCDLPGVRNRLEVQLKTLDIHLPGTYHEGAEITDLEVSFERVCHYDGIGEFLESYLQMVERARVLFFQAIETDLSEEDIHEYNFLVTVLGIRDFVCAKLGNLYYDNLHRCREIYREENLPDFYDYIRLYPDRFISPWRCAEFTENKELIQRYINYNPYHKFIMRDFAMSVLHYKCDFVWSDAERKQLYDEEYLTKEDYEAITGEPAPEHNWVPERTEIYVPKTAEELGDNEVFAQRLLELSGPEKKGGVIFPPYRNKPDNEVKRIMTRMPLIHSSNFIEWQKQIHGGDVDTLGNGGGGDV